MDCMTAEQADPQAHEPYKLGSACRVLILLGLRDGLTLKEAAAGAGTADWAVREFCHRPSPEAAAFAVDWSRLPARDCRAARRVVARALPHSFRSCAELLRHR